MHKKLISALLAAAISVGMTMTAFAATGYGTDMDDEDEYVPPVTYPSSNTNTTNPNVNNNTNNSVGNNVTTPAPGTTTVTTQQVVSNLDKAIEQAKATGTDSKAEIVVKNVTTISADTLQAAAEKAKQEGVKTNIMVDKTDVTGAIVARIYIDPEKTTTLTKDINLDVNVNNQETAVVAKTFAKHFNAEVAVVNLGQKGTFGMDVPMAVKVDLSKLDKEKLVFYSYDLTTNSFVTITNPKYFIDANGYLHFVTPIGNNIVITDKALQS